MSPSLFLYLAAGWLVLTGAGHVYGHVTLFVTRSGLGEKRRAAYELMKGDGSEGITNASFWTVLQMMSWQLTLFLLFAALVSVFVARTGDAGLMQGYSAIAGLVFGLGLLSFLFLYPQINAAIIAGGATLFFALAWWASRGSPGAA